MDGSLIVILIGLGTTWALIVAIGAQNAFVLRQGIRREHVLLIVAICTVSDVALIGLGVGGLGAVVRAWPAAVTVITWLGGGFLLGYAALAARRAVSPAPSVLPDAQRAGSAKAAALTCLALTWLNPHVYLDTILLLGSVANGYGAQRWLFAAGSVLASITWFVALGFGARLLSGLFARPQAWRALDAGIAVIMTALGVSLLAGAA